MARDCTSCTYIQGDECYLYTGPTVSSCNLVNNTWYKISDLIAAQTCAYNSLTTTTTTTSTSTSTTTTTSTSTTSTTTISSTTIV